MHQGKWAWLLYEEEFDMIDDRIVVQCWPKTGNLRIYLLQLELCMISLVEYLVLILWTGFWLVVKKH